MVYILEDDDSIRKLVTYALSREEIPAEGFALPGAFYEALKEVVPDVLLLDIMLPEEDGLSILRKLRENVRTKNMGIIMLTAKSAEYDKVTGLDQGADDYIGKPFGITELVSRVRALLRRTTRTGEAEDVFRVGDLYLDAGRHVIQVGDSEVNLSLKEYELLYTLLCAHGRVVRRDELLTRIWGEYYEESRTLDVHIRKLRVKLANAGGYIRTVKGVGYKLEAS